MTKNTIRIQSYKTIVQEVSETAACSLYCNSLFQMNEIVSFYRIPAGDIVFMGKGKCSVINEINSQFHCEVTIYKRCIYKNMVINSVLYKRATKSDDTLVLLNDGSFVRILNVLCCDDIGYVQVMELNTTNVLLCNNCDVNAGIRSPITHIENLKCKNIFKLQFSSCQKIVPIYNIKEKCILMNIDSDNIFLSPLPNTIEIQ